MGHIYLISYYEIKIFYVKEMKKENGWLWTLHFRSVPTWWSNLFLFMGELSFGGRWAPKITKGPYNASNWVEGYEIITDKYIL